MSDVSIKTLKDTKSVKGNFYVGVVEDSQDPKKLGRVRVRVMGIHIENRESGENHLKTEELPWANVLAPNVFGMSTGIGISSVPVQGTWVLVIFENDDLQKPVVLGTMKGFSTKNQSSPNQGFTDPDGIFPLKDRVNESDMNRLSRNEKYSETDLAKKRDQNLEKNNRYTNDGNSKSETWSMPPELNTKSKYPDCTVIETKSGHIVEIDDTPGNERIHVFHTSGSFTEFRPDGSFSQKTTANKYEVVNGSKLVAVNGDYIMNADGNLNESCNKDLNVAIGNNINISAGQETSIKSSSNITVTGEMIMLN